MQINAKVRDLKRLHMLTVEELAARDDISKMPVGNTSARYPLSPDEHAAMARYVASIRQQLQEVSELFGSRYGKECNLTDLSAKALVCTTLLEHELLYSTPVEGGESDASEHFAEGESVIVRAAYQGK